MTQGINPYAGQSTAVDPHDPSPTLEISFGADQRRPVYKARFDENAVPRGTISEVLDWVGTDPYRALDAQHVEMHGHQRKSLINALERIHGRELHT